MGTRIEEFIYEPLCDCPPNEVGYDREAHMTDAHGPITYWDVYLDKEKISTASTREQAEQTKEWAERWLAE